MQRGRPQPNFVGFWGAACTQIAIWQRRERTQGAPNGLRSCESVSANPTAEDVRRGIPENEGQGFCLSEFGGSCFVVKHFVRNKATRAYLSAEGTWVEDCRLAQDFQDVKSAFRTVDRLKVKGVELVLMMGQVPSEAYDITLPLGT